MAETAATISLDDSFARELTGLYQQWQPKRVAAPQLLALNTALADELGLDAEFLASPAGVALLAGNAVPESATPLAQAYSGHQFGGFSPVLGDGRALLLGELIDPAGRRRDLHLKGSGPTPFARRGDGLAAIGPMLREYVIGEAMHALGIPTTRALAVVATGEPVHRGPTLPGAVLTRVAASHLRVGTFQYAAATGDRELLTRLTRYALDRHYPAAIDASTATPAELAQALLDAVIDAQARLVAEWMLVGFVHGVMNTDNTTISGETIDYGPCAFLDAHDPAAVFSSIDHGGRYAYGNQPAIMQWNLARFAESLLALIDDDREAAVAAATETLGTYAERFTTAWTAGLRRKLALVPAAAGGDIPQDADEARGTDGAALGNELIALMASEQLDHTGTFRSLSRWLVDGTAAPAHLHGWLGGWRTEVMATGRPVAAVTAELDAVNPLYIPRNERVEEALAAATDGELAPLRHLVDIITQPYVERPGLDEFAEAASPTFAATFQTFCGT